MKNIRVFFTENFQFLEVKFSIYLNRCVFVMCSSVHPSLPEKGSTLRGKRLLKGPFLQSCLLWKCIDAVKLNSLSKFNICRHLSCISTKIEILLIPCQDAAKNRLHSTFRALWQCLSASSRYLKYKGCIRKYTFPYMKKMQYVSTPMCNVYVFAIAIDEPIFNP